MISESGIDQDSHNDTPGTSELYKAVEAKFSLSMI